MIIAGQREKRPHRFGGGEDQARSVSRVGLIHLLIGFRRVSVSLRCYKATFLMPSGKSRGENHARTVTRETWAPFWALLNSLDRI